MRIGLFSTWHSLCGIAEYSRSLVNSLPSDFDIDIFSSYPIHPVPGLKDGKNVLRFFSSGWHEETSLDEAAFLSALSRKEFQLLHLQYQGFIYPDSFLTTLKKVSPHIPLIATFHDPYIPPNFPAKQLAALIVHNQDAQEEIGINAIPNIIIPMGIPQLTDVAASHVRKKWNFKGHPIIASNGFGRTNYEAILPMIKRLSVEFPTITYLIMTNPQRCKDIIKKAAKLKIDQHVTVMTGPFNKETMFEILFAADLLLYYYPEMGVKGVASGAIRDGLGCHRPILITDVLQTKEIHCGVKVAYGDEQQLQQAAEKLLKDEQFRAKVLTEQDQFVKENSWSIAAEKHAALYKSLV